MEMTTIGYSPVKSGKTQMKYWFREKFDSGQCLDPASHRRFVNRDRRFINKSP
ncbi:hypothetical protein HAX54_011410, partial [Datura stramonium]|nr:hypothetical protein [Datura stramonium]